MRDSFKQHSWQQAQSKKHAHWGILTLEDLPRTKVRYSQLITQIQAQPRAAKESSMDKTGHKSEDFSI